MLIKSADDKSKRLALLQDLQQPLVPESATLFPRGRGYARKGKDHCSVTHQPNRCHPVQSKSANL